MVFKPSPEQKCFIHREPIVALCSWCSTPICDNCILEANGKKYCKKCLNKKGYAERPAPSERKAFGEAPRQPIRNVDPSFQPGTKK
ncbi:MAG: B-box zinc finger protein [archaeon]